MDSLNDLLSSISPEDMEKIKSVASSLTAPSTPSSPSASAASSAQPSAVSSAPSGLGTMLSDDMSGMLMRVASQMNKDSDKTAFIKALRPLLSDERQKKADEAMRFLKLMDTLPLLRGMFG